MAEYVRIYDPKMKKALRWKRYYQSHLEKERARGLAGYYANREAILARRKEQRDAKKREAE